MLCKTPSIARDNIEKRNDKKNETSAIVMGDGVDAMIAINEM